MRIQSIVFLLDGFNGQATYYDPGVGYSACGSLHPTNELVAALNAPQFDPSTPNGNPNKNTLCNRLVQVRGPRGSVTLKIVDKCPSCRYVSTLIEERWNLISVISREIWMFHLKLFDVSTGVRWMKDEWTSIGIGYEHSYVTWVVHFD